MSQELSNEQLDNVLGTRGTQFEKYRTLSIDNGTDLAGTGATGYFIEKNYNKETKTSERIQYAPEFTGVILSAQAMLVDKGKRNSNGQYVPPTWKTEEFDMGDVQKQIAIFPLSEGMLIKDSEGKIKKTYATYRQIKKSRSITNPDGTTTNTYEYYIVLYVGIIREVKNEIIKLKFKGTGRGNFFDYSKSLNYIGAKLYNIMTEFSTYRDKSTGKYTIKFDVVKNDKGVPVSIDDNAVRDMRVRIANSFIALSTLSNRVLSAPKNKQIYQPEISTKEEEIPTITEEEEIEIEEIPYD